jgi:hypothetical protein
MCDKGHHNEDKLDNGEQPVDVLQKVIGHDLNVCDNACDTLWRSFALFAANHHLLKSINHLAQHLPAFSKPESTDADVLGYWRLSGGHFVPN